MAGIKKIKAGDFLSIEALIQVLVFKVNELIDAHNEHCHQILPDNRRFREDIPVTGYPRQHPNS